MSVGISNTEATDAELKDLGCIPEAEKFRTFWSTQLTDAGLKELVALKELRGIKYNRHKGDGHRLEGIGGTEKKLERLWVNTGHHGRGV